jgi:hypothetical protein
MSGPVLQRPAIGSIAIRRFRASEYPVTVAVAWRSRREHRNPISWSEYPESAAGAVLDAVSPRASALSLGNVEPVFDWDYLFLKEEQSTDVRDWDWENCHSLCNTDNSRALTSPLLDNPLLGVQGL